MRDKIQKEMETTVCPKCGKTIFKQDEVAFVCSECGSIVLVEEPTSEAEDVVVGPLPSPDPGAITLPPKADPMPAPAPDYGREPVVDVEQGLALYGIYPQKKVSDPKLLMELDSLVEPTENGWYFHKGKFYAKGSRGWFLCSPILWRIASKKQGRILLVANSILDLRPFQEIGGEPAYEASSLRGWLNGEFLSTAFCLDSSKLLPALELEEDKVFLLSVDEYSNPDFGFDPSPMEIDPNRGAIPSEYVKSKGAVLSFFTRSKGTRMEGMIRCFKINGTLTEIPAASLGGVRPAIWIEAD